MDLPATPERGEPCPDLRAYGLPWLDALAETPQSPVWHGEGDVLIHTRMVADELLRDERHQALDDEARTELWLAALLHDVGKPATTRYENGHYRAPGHARRGAIIARRLLWEAGDRAGGARADLRARPPPHGPAPPDRARGARRAACIEISLEAGARRQYLLTRADALGRIADDVDAAGDQRRAVRRVRARARLPGRAVPVRLRPRALHLLRAATTATPPTPRTTTRAAASSCSPACPARARTCGSPATATAGRSSRSTTCVASAASSAGTRRRGPADPGGARARPHLPARRRAVHLERDEPLGAAARADAALLADYHAHITIVAVEAPADDLSRRNRDREHPVPWEAIERMLDRWEAPTITECHRLEVWSA